MWTRKQKKRYATILAILVGGLWVGVIVAILWGTNARAEPKAIDVMNYRMATPDTAPKFYPRGMTAISAIHLENAAPKKRVVDVRPYRRSYK